MGIASLRHCRFCNCFSNELHTKATETRSDAGKIYDINTKRQYKYLHCQTPEMYAQRSGNVLIKVY